MYVPGSQKNYAPGGQYASPSRDRRNISHSTSTTDKATEDTEAELVKSFRKGIKRDASVYPVLKVDKNWDSFQRSFMVTARAQNVADILEQDYDPSTTTTPLLDKNKQIFLLSVLDKNVLTSHGMQTVRKYADHEHCSTLIWRGLVQHARRSTHAIVSTEKLLEYITTATISEWRGKSHDFVLNWTVCTLSMLPLTMIHSVLR